MFSFSKSTTQAARRSFFSGAVVDATSPDYLPAKSPQRFAARLTVGHRPIEGRPEISRVVRVGKVDEFVRDHVIDQLRRGLDDTPVEADVAAGIGGAPSLL